MKKIHIAELFEFLSENGHISVPMLMKRFDLCYEDAKNLMSCVIERGWASEKPDGAEYEVIGEHLTLQSFTRKELKEICKGIDNDCAAVINYLMKNYRASYGELVKAVRGDYDTKMAIHGLKEKKIICEHNGQFFLNLDRATCETLNIVAGEKLRRSRRSRIPGLSADDEID